MEIAQKRIAIYDKKEKTITILFQLLLNPSGEAIPTGQCTGWQE